MKLENMDETVKDIVNISVNYIVGVMEWNGEVLNLHKENLFELIKKEILEDKNADK